MSGEKKGRVFYMYWEAGKEGEVASGRGHFLKKGVKSHRTEIRQKSRGMPGLGLWWQSRGEGRQGTGSRNNEIRRAAQG